MDTKKFGRFEEPGHALTGDRAAGPQGDLSPEDQALHTSHQPARWSAFTRRWCGSGPTRWNTPPATPRRGAATLARASQRAALPFSARQPPAHRSCSGRVGVRHL